MQARVMEQEFERKLEAERKMQEEKEQEQQKIKRADGTTHVAAFGGKKEKKRRVGGAVE